MKSTQLFVILLLISFILFLIFQLDCVERKEGFETEVPTCQSGVTGSAPGCYATVQEDDYLSYSDYFNSDYYFNADDYILKTKIVTPVCPNNPYDNMGSILNDLSFNLQLNFPTMDLSGTSTNPAPVPSNQTDLSNNASIQLPDMPSLPDPSISTPQKPVDPKPACKEDTSSTPDVCPPCPACERCPEPVVDCKKVIHYKDQQYPVPVISDFSHFSRF